MVAALYSMARSRARGVKVALATEVSGVARALLLVAGLGGADAGGGGGGLFRATADDDCLFPAAADHDDGVAARDRWRRVRAEALSVVAQFVRETMVTEWGRPCTCRSLSTLYSLVPLLGGGGGADGGAEDAAAAQSNDSGKKGFEHELALRLMTSIGAVAEARHARRTLDTARLHPLFWV